MHFRVFTLFVSVTFAGITSVAAAPPNVLSASATLSSLANLTIQGVVQNATTFLTPILANIETAVSNATSVNEDELLGNLDSATIVLSTLQTQLAGLSADAGTTEAASAAEITTVLAPFLSAVSGVFTTVSGTVSSVPVIGSIVAPVMSTISSVTSSILDTIEDMVPGETSAITPILSTLGLGSFVSSLPV